MPKKVGREVAFLPPAALEKLLKTANPFHYWDTLLAPNRFHGSTWGDQVQLTTAQLAIVVL